MKHSKAIIIIFLIAIIFRIWSFWNVSIIQRDSPIYLYQAMTIAANKKELIYLCGDERIKQVNLYSLSIIPFYKLVNDWEIAGKLISFFSSFATFILLYYLLKKYFSTATLSFILLIYAVNPLIIKESAEVMRESLFTFYLMVGLFAFIRGLNDYRLLSKFLWYTFSISLWLLSCWIRVEGLSVILFSLVFLTLNYLRHNSNSLKSSMNVSLKDPIIFLFLPLVITTISLLFFDIYKTFLLNELRGKIHFSALFNQPALEILEKMKYSQSWSPTPYFWDMVKQNLWLIAIGTTIFYKFIPALHFSNLPFLIFGIKDIKQSIKNYLEFRYMFYLSFSYLVMLSFFTYTKWYMEKRYMLPLIYFLSPIIGIGIEKSRNYLQYLSRNNNFIHNFIPAFLVFYVIFFGIIEVAKPVRKELNEIKVLAQILSRTISKEELKNCAESACKNLILTGDPRILFYLSNYSDYPLCPASSSKYTYLELFKKSDEEIISIIKERSYKIVILERRFLRDRTEGIKEQLDKLGISTYVIK